MAWAMGLSESPVAGDQRRTEALGQGDIYSIGHGVSTPQFIGALDEWLYGPTSNRQTVKVPNGDEPFMIADQPARSRSAYRPDHLDVEVSGGMYRLAPQPLGNHRARPCRKDQLDGR